MEKHVLCNLSSNQDLRKMVGVLARVDNASAEEWEECWGLADQPSLTDL